MEWQCGLAPEDHGCFDHSQRAAHDRLPSIIEHLEGNSFCYHVFHVATRQEETWLETIFAKYVNYFESCLDTRESDFVLQVHT